MSDVEVVREEVTPGGAGRFDLKKVTFSLGGNEITHELIHTRDGVIVIAINDQNQVCLIHQTRPNLGGQVWEFPSGWSSTENPSPEQIVADANRELSEEAGLVGSSTHIAASFKPATYITGTYHVVVVRDLEPRQSEGDELEKLEANFFSIDQAREMVFQHPTTAQCLIALNVLEKELKSK